MRTPIRCRYCDRNRAELKRLDAGLSRSALGGFFCDVCCELEYNRPIPPEPDEAPSVIIPWSHIYALPDRVPHDRAPPPTYRFIWAPSLGQFIRPVLCNDEPDLA